MSRTNPDEAVTTEPTNVDQGRAGAIHIDGLTKEFETNSGYELVFDEVDIDIEPRSFVSLIGKSGSGKSTLLKIISGVLEPTDGEVWFEVGDQRVQSTNSDRIKLGYVFQSPRLLPWNTCVDNIEFVHEGNPDYSDEVAREYLSMVGLSEHYDKYPTQLSGGQKQRVGIARAFSIDPDILLMDEPFSNLDEITAQQLRKELMNIWSKLNKTVFFVTHDINEAIELSDRILMLGDQRVYGDLEVPLDRPRDLDSEEFLEFREHAIDKFYSIDE
ncbi:MAG: ABC transporter ATP-binding protein [Halorhabdus sp.]